MDGSGVLKVSVFALDVDGAITEDGGRMSQDASMNVKSRASYVRHMRMADGLIEGIVHTAERFMNLSLEDV